MMSLYLPWLSFALCVDDFIYELFVEHVVDMLEAITATAFEFVTNFYDLMDPLRTELSDLDFWKNVEIKHPPFLVINLTLRPRIDLNNFHANLLGFVRVHWLLMVLMDLGFHGLDRIEAHHLVRDKYLSVQVSYLELALMLSVFKSFVKDIAHDVVRRQVVLILHLLDWILIRIQRVCLLIGDFNWVMGVEHLLVVRNNPRGRGLELLLQLKLLPYIPCPFTFLSLKCMRLELAVDLVLVVIGEASSVASLGVVSVRVRNPAECHVLSRLLGLKPVVYHVI